MCEQPAAPLLPRWAGEVHTFGEKSGSIPHPSWLARIDPMRRREFISLLGGGAAAWPLAARAQQSGKTYRIGFLGPGSYAGRKRDIDALRMALRRLGYEEG